MNIDKALQNWIIQNESLTDYPLFSWLNEKNGAVAIIPIPTESGREFIGGRVKEVTYDFMVQAALRMSDTTDDLNTENMMTLRQWQDWVDEQEIAGNYPDFGEGYGGYELQNLSDMPAIAEIDKDGEMAIFQFPVRLIYLKEIKKWQ